VSGAQTLPLIEVLNVSKRFGDQLAVDKLSFEVRRGEIVALLGKTGAGKSTVMNMLMGTIGCDEGGVRVAGAGVRPIGEKPALDRLLERSLGDVGAHAIPRPTVTTEAPLPTAEPPDLPCSMTPTLLFNNIE